MKKIHSLSMFVIFQFLFFNSIICGPQRVPKISRGTKAIALNYPSQVLILTGDTDGRVCGGSIISSEWIMTAAHCVRRNEDGEIHFPLFYKLVFGAQNRFEKEETQVIRNIAKIVNNPDYESSNHSNDIALIKMSKPLNFDQSPHLKPMCLDLRGDSIENKQCFLTGFGRMGEDYIPVSEELKQIEMKLFDQQKCAEIHHAFYENEKSKEEVTDKQFCMVSTAQPKEGQLSDGGGCAGDSGSPLRCKVNNVWYQFGIAWSATHCSVNPTVFQHVYKYADFIKKTTNYELPAYCSSTINQR